MMLFKPTDVEETNKFLEDLLFYILGYLVTRHRECPKAD